MIEFEKHDTKQKKILFEFFDTKHFTNEISRI